MKKCIDVAERLVFLLRNDKRCDQIKDFKYGN
jgi:hypothetical protein